MHMCRCDYRALLSKKIAIPLPRILTQAQVPVLEYISNGSSTDRAYYPEPGVLETMIGGKGAASGDTLSILTSTCDRLLNFCSRVINLCH